MRRLLAVALVLFASRAWADHVNTYSAGDTVRCDTTFLAPTATAVVGGAVTVYKDDGTTKSTSGVTFTASRDSNTGYAHLSIDTSSDGTFYATGHYFDAMFSAGTVGGASIVSVEFCSFRIVSSSSSGPTLSQIVNGVWDEPESSHVTSNTFGYYLDARVSTRSTLTASTVTVAGPVLTDTSITVVRGDDYNSSDTGRAITWTITGYPDFTAGSVSFTATRGSTTVTKTGYVTSSTVIGVNLTSTDTSALTVGTAAYSVKVTVTLSNGRVVTPVITTMSVL